MDTQLEKKQIRQKIAQKIARLTDGQRFSSSVSVCSILQELIVHLPGKTIAVYLAREDEPDLAWFIAWCVQQSYTLVIPKIPYETHLFQIHQTQQDWGGLIDMVIVPGVAFTRKGKRLGRGGGRYDRVLASVRQQNPNCLVVGCCFSQQLVDTLPSEPHDQQMDMVVYG